MNYCSAHLERTGAKIPVHLAGLCLDCYNGKPISEKETVGANWGKKLAEDTEFSRKLRHRKTSEPAHRYEMCPVCQKNLKQKRAKTCRPCWHARKGDVHRKQRPSFLLDRPLSDTERLRRYRLRKRGIAVTEVYNIAHRQLRSALARA